MAIRLNASTAGPAMMYKTSSPPVLPSKPSAKGPMISNAAGEVIADGMQRQGQHRHDAERELGQDPHNEDHQHDDDAGRDGLVGEHWS